MTESIISITTKVQFYENFKFVKNVKWNIEYD